VQNSGSFSTKKLSMGLTANKVDSFQTDSAMKLRRGSSGNDLHSGKKYYQNSFMNSMRNKRDKQMNESQHQQPEPVYAPISLMYLKYSRQRQQAVLMLQHCAILSQLNRH
jgi:hypothetical protein